MKKRKEIITLLGCKASSPQLKQLYRSSMEKEVLEPCFKGGHEHRVEKTVESVIS